MASKTGGPAFPSEQGECQDGTWNQTYDSGMSLRDYFAGQALAGICSDNEATDGMRPAALARWCWKIADEMLKAREEL